jgi:cyclic pyranopterin phosphate synthase
VSASISTPVWAVVRASAIKVTIPVEGSTWMSTSTNDSGSWWQSGISSSVRLAARVVAGDNPKGDVVAVTRIAAIQAAKRTDELIPLCHSLPLAHVDPEVAIDADAGTVTLVVETRTTDRTGVEMEAMVACSVGALTVYDMVKGIEPGVVIEQVELLDKTGGKADFHRP